MLVSLPAAVDQFYSHCHLVMLKHPNLYVSGLSLLERSQYVMVIVMINISSCREKSYIVQNQ